MSHRRFVLPLAVTSALALSACGDSGDSGDSGTEGSVESLEIVMVQGVTGAPFAQTAASGAEDAAVEAGVEFSVAGPANIDPSAETKIFQQVVATGPDGIVLQELPPDLFTRLVADAEDAGIVVMPYTIAPAADSTSTTFVGDDGRDLGQMAAERMAAELMEIHGPDVAGTIVTGICVPGLSVLTQRLDGFKAEMAEQLPAVEVLDPFDSKTDPAADFAAWQQAVSANPDALAMISPCEVDNQNLVKIKQTSGADWLLTPFDINDEVLSGIKDGLVLAIFPQSSYMHGYVATRILAESLQAGEPLPAGWVEMPIVPVDSTNIDEIIERQSSIENQRAFWKPYIDEIFATTPVETKSLDEANK